MPRFFVSILVIGLAVSVGSRARANEVRGLVTIGMQRVFEDLRPQFEAASGAIVDVQFASSPALAKRIQGGEPADFVIANRAAIDSLVTSGKLSAGDQFVIALSSIVAAVPAGASKPDVSTVEGLKSALLAARRISYTDPASGGPSGLHLAKVLERLGIAEQVKVKTRFPPPDTFVGDVLARGDADIGFQQAPELSGFRGVEIVAPIPDELQDRLEYDLGIPATASQRDLAEALVRFIRSAQGGAVLRSKGLDTK